jgi:hypothetical protein
MSGALYRAILRCAAVLAPASQRADWLAEWRGELWHVRRGAHGVNVTVFCLGAFRDAFWLWRDGSYPDGDWVFAESPARCLAWLAALGAVCFAVSLLLPAARTVLLGSLYPRDLVMLTPAGADGAEMTNGFIAPHPSVSREQFESMKAYGGEEFSGLTFYVPAPHGTKGFAVGRLRHDSMGKSPFHFVRLADRSLGLLGVVPATFLFACILLRIMTTGFRAGHLGRIGPRRGLFLGAKALLVLTIVMFGSLDLGSLGGGVSPVFLDIAFFGSLLGVRWMVADQRRRCPVCLRLLVNPVRIGETSRILLEWHGTELMCLRGHGMLYVPEWPAIWSGRQRWMGLGSSWGGLFL